MMKLKNGKEVNRKLLACYEALGFKESEIAFILGITRMGLWKVRQRLNCPQLSRSDRGLYRNGDSREQRRAKQREYSKRYREEHPGKASRYAIQIRRIFVEAVGRYPRKNEVVHHVDGNLKNNSRNNLVICTHKYHMATFHTGDRR